MLVRTPALVACGGLAAWVLSSCVLLTGGVPGAGGTGGAAGSGGSVMSSSTSATVSSSSSSSSSTSTGGGGAPPNTTCADGIQNGMETDVDCGGDACPPCPLGDKCQVGADCATGTCAAGRCAPTTTTACDPVVQGLPSCHDCAKDGLETDVDCGGDACPPCALGKACLVDADCAGGACQFGTCVASTKTCEPVDPQNPSCADCVKDGMETDVDCGGDACPPCALGKACLVDADCASGDCATGICAAGTPACQPVDPANPTCNDCVKDGLETDVDCGGDACPPCEPVKACQTGADCLSGACASGTCQHGAAGTACFGGRDCASGVCSPGKCWTGLCCG